jgi:hypothetical protein
MGLGDIGRTISRRLSGGEHDKEPLTHRHVFVGELRVDHFDRPIDRYGAMVVFSIDSTIPRLTNKPPDLDPIHLTTPQPKAMRRRPRHTLTASHGARGRRTRALGTRPTRSSLPSTRRCVRSLGLNRPTIRPIIDPPTVCVCPRCCVLEKFHPNPLSSTTNRSISSS